MNEIVIAAGVVWCVCGWPLFLFFVLFFTVRAQLLLCGCGEDLVACARAHKELVLVRADRDVVDDFHILFLLLKGQK